MDELLPCPKCGGTAKYRYSKPFHYIRCRNTNCGFASEVACDYYEEADPESKKDVIKIWNNYPRKWH